MFDKIYEFRVWFNKLSDKKKHIEFITAILSVPVLLSVIFLNYSSIRNQEKDKTNVSPTAPVITIIQQKDTDEKNTPTPKPQCKPDVGPVTIESPQEGETISDNPLTINIDQNDLNNDYCAVVWSYRINGGSWSNFDDTDISIFNMNSGDKVLEVRVKSVISGKEKKLTRKFTYKNTQEVPTPTVTTIPTQTPSPTPTVILPTSSPV